MDLNQIRSAQQKAWSKGDFSVVASTIVIVSEMLAEAVELRPGQKVLDVATGSGNTALSAARRWCDVTGVDFVPDLLVRARERAAAERLPVEFQYGETEKLPFPESSFDVVLSTFGVMFAPDQEKAAGELLRVLKPGGTIGMANWTPDGFIGEMFKLPARYLPPPAGLKPPVLWGTEERLSELFRDAAEEIRVGRRQVIFRFPSVDAYVQFMRTYFGPTKNQFEQLDPDGQERMAREMGDIIRCFNRPLGVETVRVPADYSEVVIVKK